MEICKQQNEITMRHLPAVDRFKRALEWAWKIFFDLSIGIDETNTYQVKLFI